MRHLLAFKPLERLAIDFLKLDVGKGNIENVLVMTDSFTKFSLAVPCKEQTARTVARVLRDNWFCHYGVPAQIHSDQGKNFENRLIGEFCVLSPKPEPSEPFLTFLKQRCYWPGMAGQVRTHVQTCFQCTLTKRHIPTVCLAPFWGQYSGLPPNPWPQHQMYTNSAIFSLLFCNDPRLKTR